MNLLLCLLHFLRRVIPGAGLDVRERRVVDDVRDLPDGADGPRHRAEEPHRNQRRCLGGRKGLLFENRPALDFCNHKENKKNNIRMLDTLFIEDFRDSMEEYFHF